MKILSLFSGIGGLELGLEAAGFGPVCWQVEKNRFARAVLAHHWPDAERFSHVESVSGDDFPGCDMIIGGFPCGDISLMGKGAGIDGQNSGLWREFARLVCEIRPRLVIVENVPYLARKGLDRILRDLSEAGYDAEWETISARDCGAPHKRERLFIIAYLSHTSSKRLEDSGPWNRLYEAESPRKIGWPHEWATEPAVGRVAYGIRYRVDQLRCLGNAVVPICAAVVGLRAWEILEAQEVTSEAWALPERGVR